MKQSYVPKPRQPRNWSQERILGLSGQNFKLKPVNLYEIEEDKIYTWSYQAITSGTTGKGLSIGDGFYDQNPLCLVLGASMKGILALNTHYLEMLPYKTKFIFKFRRGTAYNNNMISLMIHRYRLDRIKSQIFEVNDLVVDYEILKSKATWRKIDTRSPFLYGDK